MKFAFKADAKSTSNSILLNLKKEVRHEKGNHRKFGSDSDFNFTLLI